MGCTGVAEEKAVLRREVREQAAQLPEILRKAQDKALFKAFLGLEPVKNGKTVLVFWGMDPEPETTGLISALLAYGKQVALPVCRADGTLEARLYRGGRLVRNRYGIPEPGEDCPRVEREDLDVVLVPALCYDRKGFRLGRGKGFYDRFLAEYTGVSVGMCYKELVREELPRQEHDLPVKILLTIT